MKTNLSDNSMCGRNAGVVYILLLLASAAQLAAHVGVPPLSSQGKALPIGYVQQFALPPTDVAAELAADGKAGKPTPLRFAVPVPVVLTTTNSGTWEQLPEGRLWRLRLVSASATDLNFGFTQFWLPAGATLYVISEADNSYEGPYTAADNTPASQLWTPVVPGEAAIVELFIPSTATEEPRLMLTQVGTGYRDLCHRGEDLGIPKAGSCEVDVNCPQAAPWSSEIRSVARILIGGSGLCTGTLLNDVSGNWRPFFLTANHCEINSGNAASVVVYWNYQSSVCGNHGLSPTNSGTTSGAVFRAARADVDFCLIELNQVPPLSHRVYYAGWDRSGAAPASGVCIHHPNADGKCISWSSSALSTTDNCIGTGGTSTGTHWRVPWHNPPTGYGVTEPGSSGSAVFDAASHRVVGDLSGGPSSCTASAADLWDCFGKFSLAWASGSSSADRLRDWLDPEGTGVTGVSGTDPTLTSALVLTSVALVSEGCLPANGVIDPGETVTVSFTLKNFGGVSTTNLVAALRPIKGVILPGAPQTYGAIASGASATRSFTFTACSTCGGTINPVLQLSDGPRVFADATYVIGSGTTSYTLGVPTPTTFWAENFDGVTAPVLPSGWASSPAGVWVTTTAQRDTLPNSVFAPNATSVSDYQLTSASISVPATNPPLTFKHRYNLESGFDGGVLEISINGGAFTDIISAGGSFLANGYNATLSTIYSNPLAGRSAWSGDSGSFVTTTVNLPPGAAGQSIRLRWRLGNDISYGYVGWYVDTISLSQTGYTCCSSPPVIVNPERVAPGGVVFSYNLLPDRTYVVEGKTSITTANWTALQTNSGACTLQSYTNTGLPQRYFRVRMQ